LVRIVDLKRNKDVNGLITILTEGSIDKAEKAAEALGELRDKKAVKPLIKALDSQYTGLRVMAVRALGNINDEEAVTPLIYLLPIGGYLTIESTIALKKILGDKAIDLFIKILKGEVNGAKDIVARWSAAETLGRLKNTRAVQPLIDVLHDESKVSS